EQVLGDAHTVDLRAVGRAHVHQQEAVAGRADLGVVAADVGVGEHDVALGPPADADDVLLEREPVAGRQHQAAGAGAAGALAEAALDLEPPGAEGLVDDHLDLDRAHEPVALVAGVGPGGVGQLTPQRVLDLPELLVVARRQVDGEVVRGHRLATDADRDVVVHLPGQAAGELDGSDARPVGAGERALDHAFQPPFETTDRHEWAGYRCAPSFTLSGAGRGHGARARRWWILRTPRYRHGLAARASGGIGRRAGFRCQCPKGRGGS